MTVHDSITGPWMWPDYRGSRENCFVSHLLYIHACTYTLVRTHTCPQPYYILPSYSSDFHFGLYLFCFVSACSFCLVSFIFGVVQTVQNWISFSNSNSKFLGENFWMVNQSQVSVVSFLWEQAWHQGHMHFHRPQSRGTEEIKTHTARLLKSRPLCMVSGPLSLEPPSPSRTTSLHDVLSVQENRPCLLVCAPFWYRLTCPYSLWFRANHMACGWFLGSLHGSHWPVPQEPEQELETSWSRSRKKFSHAQCIHAYGSTWVQDTSEFRHAGNTPEWTNESPVASRRHQDNVNDYQHTLGIRLS